MAFSRKKTVSKIMTSTSVWKFHISKSVNRIETITCRKFLKYLLAVDEESKRKLLNLISTDSFIKNNNVYDFGVKISIIHA